MFEKLTNRLYDVIASVYIYNEYTGYKELEKLLVGLEEHYPSEQEFIKAVKKHYADEKKHYLMFRYYFKKRKCMPFKIDKTYGYVDLFVEHIFKKPIEELDHDELINDKDLFFKLCRLVMMTEFRGMRQVHTLLKNPLIKRNKALFKIFKVVERDEPSHCYPYQYWLEKYESHTPQFQEKITDLWIHYSLMLLKVPFLFFNLRLERMTAFYDEKELVTA
ncbi:MAG: ferritin-like domain-containing protein [Bacteroidota bacterium]